MIWIAQTSQPARWVWTNFSLTELALMAGAVYGGIRFIEKVGVKLIKMKFGWKKTEQEQLFDLQQNQKRLERESLERDKALAAVASPTKTATAIQAAVVNAIADAPVPAPTIDEPKRDK